MPLYVLGGSTDALYPVDGVGDTNPGRAGSAVWTRTDSQTSAALGLAWDGETFFLAAGPSDTSLSLYSVDLDNGSISLIGALTFSEAFILQGMTWDGENLYGVIRIGSGARLVTINRTTGVLTQVGTALSFGTVGETHPQGVAWDGSHLWVVGNTVDGLIRVDKTTGIGTRVGSASQYGVSEFNMNGLAFEGANLLGVGGSNNALFTINRTTGVATQVGSETQFGQSLTNPHGLVSTDFPTANTAPTWTTIETDYSLPADVAVGTVVATLVASDTEGDTLSYSLTGDDSGLFAISSSGVVTVADSLVNGTTYSISAVVSDANSNTSLALTIKVRNPGELTSPAPAPVPPVPQIEGLIEYRERYDVIRTTPAFSVVRSNVEMIKHRGDTSITRPAEAAGLTFVLSIVDYTPVYAIPDLETNDWIVEHNPDGWTEAPDPTAVAVWVVQGPVEIGDAKKQVIVTKIT